MKKPDKRIEATVDAIAFAYDACLRTATDKEAALLGFDEGTLHHGFFANFRWHRFTREGLLAVIRAIAENAPPDVLGEIHASAKVEAGFWRDFAACIAYEIRTGKPSKRNLGYHADGAA